MIFKLTTRRCRVSEQSKKHLQMHLDKIIQVLPNLAEDLLVFRMFLNRNIDNYLPKRRHRRHKSYTDTKPALAYFEGSITFRLDKKRLYTRFKGQTIDECIDSGFKLIFKKLEKYKDLHFPSESEYHDHSSIRGENFYG